MSMSDYAPECWMCRGGTLRIFVDENDGKVKIEHVGEPCDGWLASKRLARGSDELIDNHTNRFESVVTRALKDSSGIEALRDVPNGKAAEDAKESALCECLPGIRSSTCKLHGYGYP
jgi:hypothetical protein